MKNIVGIMVLAFGLYSCSKKIYVKSDYNLYEKDFKLPSGTNLRTDGVYVLDTIWSGQNGGTARKAGEHVFYNFYSTGHVNLTVDLDHKIKTLHHYKTSIDNHLVGSNQKGFKTGFEGYYQLIGNQIVIERINVPRNVFIYSYGYVENNILIIVKETIDGKGKFKDKYFTDYYKATYKFKSLEQYKPELLNVSPGW